MRAPQRWKRLVLAMAVVVVGMIQLLIAPEASAAKPGDVEQLTTALDAFDRWVGDGANGDKWRKYLASQALRSQIEKGAQADPAVVARVLQQYRTDKNGLNMRPAVAVRRELQSWLAALQNQYRDDLSKLAWASRGDYIPVEVSARLRPARKRLRARAQALEQTLGGNSPFAMGWKRYLKWDLLEPHLARDTKTDDRSLDDMTTVLRKLRSHHEGLEHPAFTQTAEALEQYRALVSWYAMVDETGKRSRRKYQQADLERAVYQLQMKELEKQLTRHQESPTDESTRQVGRLLGLVEHLGHSDALVAAIRSRITRPNLLTSISASAINRLGSRPVHQHQPVRDTILGARVRGSAVSNGIVSFRTIPAHDHVEIEVQLAGDIHSNTVGYKKPVRVTSHGHTNYFSTKRILISDDRFVALPANTQACTNNRTCSVEKTGGRFGRRLIERIARKKVAESKSKAERIASQKSGRKVSSRFDDEIAEAIYEARNGYDYQARPPLVRVGMFPEHLRMSSTANNVNVEATLATYQQISTYQSPPNIEVPDSDFSIQVHETSINNLSPSILAGIRLRQDSASEPPTIEGNLPTWLKQLARDQREKHRGFLTPQEGTGGSAEGPMLNAPPKSDKSFKPWSFKLSGEHPISVSFDDQKFTVRVRIEELTTIEEGKPTVRHDWDFLVTYRIEQENGQIVLRREGKIEVFPTGYDPHWLDDPRWNERSRRLRDPFLSVFRGNLNRRADAGEGFPSEIRVPPLDFRLPSGRQLKLDLARLNCDNGWLTLNYQISGSSKL